MRILVGVAIALSVLLVLNLSAPTGALGNETINYRYDARGQLTNVSHSGSVNDNLQANYTYDKAGNRATVNVTGSPN